MSTRQAVPIETKRLVLHESGYKCANPVCRTILTIEIHHIEYVSENGSNEPENLLPLCPNCHSLHHQGTIPVESLRSWKMLLLSLNEAFDRRAVDLLLALDKSKDSILVSGDGLLNCAALLASDMVRANAMYHELGESAIGAVYELKLTNKGKSFVHAWKRGDQRAAVTGAAEPVAPPNGGPGTLSVNLEPTGGPPSVS